ncbi:MAG: hydantoinase/oxoprolinase family protein [Armatimonadota bacterium]|nr:hydantoinase/oxoprolinase family protein [Armatimonadota bacterium]MDR7469209.1 hydantoinase/oxoprolinase family protein [Armatimonadota bacterium]MDR7474726.1 hydantoinase/oxoprolinase family protein [Armatimonadota bacterium]
MIRIGVDVGGTFTDLVAFREHTGETSLIKVPSTPTDPAEGVTEAIRRFLSGPGRAWEAVLSSAVLIHASTIGANLLLGQKGLRLPRGALVTTQGFRDVLEIGRQRRPDLYDLFFKRPAPLVERRHRFTVPERMDAQGEVVLPLDEGELRRIAGRMQEEGIEAVAVCFLHAYANPAHEVAARRILQEHLPRIPVVISSQVNPEYREYERTSTTVVNALLIPVISSYLRRLKEKAGELGLTCPIHVMQSNGGLATVEEAATLPAATIESGPAAGVVASAHLGTLLGASSILSFDMGGTTAKAGAIIGGLPQVVTEYEVGGRVHSGRIVKGSGYPVRFPFIDLAEVSAGGGTIAWLDPAGGLRCGPLSAGAYPGPACYGLGGEDPTVTDANLLLGRMNPKGLLGGEMPVVPSLSAKVLREKIADRLGLDPVAAAAGMLQIVNTQMVRALRLVSLERGYDPRSMVLVAFGGAGPMHAAFLAEELGVREVVIPAAPGVFSALGLVVSDFKHDYVRSAICLAAQADPAVLEKAFRELERAAAAQLRREGIPEDRVLLQRHLDLRYLGQSYEITIPARSALDTNALRTAARTFHRRHAEVYGYAAENEPVEVVNLRLTATGITEKPALWPAQAHTPTSLQPRGDAQMAERPVYFEATGWASTPVYWRPLFHPARDVEGPAIIEQYDATTVVPPGWKVAVDEGGNLRLQRAPGHQGTR